MRGSLLSVLTNVTMALSSASSVSQDAPAYQRFIKMAGGDGLMHDVDLEGLPDIKQINEIKKNPADNLYLLYTRRNSNQSQTLIFNDRDSITKSNFNFELPTIIIGHGWLSNQSSEPNPTIRRVYLDKMDCNVITVDWSRLSKFDYITAVHGTPTVGRGVGQFLRFIQKVTGARFDNMHLIGFSLGAHLIGNAGKELNGQVVRVTGLDPAGPLWYLNKDRIGPADGVYVECIHTDGTLVIGQGIGKAICDADFFPNGGKSQPGCSTSLTNICNHNRAWQLFAATVTFDHLVGRRCSTTLQITLNTCNGSRFNMGNDDLKKRGTGMYRVNTSGSYPYKIETDNQ